MARYNIKIKYYDSGEIQIHTFPNGVDFDSSTLLSDHCDFLPSSDDVDFDSSTLLSDHCDVLPSSDHSYDNCVRSLRRSKGLFFDYALNNLWQYFVTFTFDSLHDRYNLDSCNKSIRKWLQNFKSRYCNDFKYLGTFEYHKDGAIHYHFLVSGSDLDKYLIPSDLQQLYPNMYYCPFYHSRNLWDPVRSSIAIACYMCKYISKQLGVILARSTGVPSNREINKTEKNKFSEEENNSSVNQLSALAPSLESPENLPKVLGSDRITRFICSRNLSKPESREFFISSTELPEGIDLASYVIDNFFPDYEIQNVSNGRRNSSFIRLK